MFAIPRYPVKRAVDSLMREIPRYLDYDTYHKGYQQDRAQV